MGRSSYSVPRSTGKIIWGSFFIGLEFDHCLPLSVTSPCLVDLIDATLAFEDVDSKLDAVSDADVGAEECADHSLVEILKKNFGRDSEAVFQSIFDMS